MAKNDEMLDLDALECVSGGTAKNRTAYCRKCGNEVVKDGTIHIGGLTNIYHCSNIECSEFNKTKNNSEVDYK